MVSWPSTGENNISQSNRIMYEFYNKYIQSEAWRRKRRKFFTTKMYNTYPAGKKAGKFVCYCCGSDERLDLHHRTYKRLGEERIQQDFIPVCKKCHSDIHKLHKKGRPLWGATKMVRHKIRRKLRKKLGKRLVHV